VDEERAGRDRGFTLIEIAITLAIVATTVAAGIGISLASRSFAVATALSEFDHLLDSTRTIAREMQGATLAFAPDAYGDGTEVRLLVAGPDGTLAPTTVPTLHTRAAIEEAESLGKAPFALVVHTGGALSGRPGFRAGGSMPTEVGCPARGAFRFVIHAAGASGERYVPCRVVLATTGPAPLASLHPASPAPVPTACNGSGCGPVSLPAPPSSSPSCPPNYVPVPGGCVPMASGPRYHVTASLGSSSMSVGGSTPVTAQATLTNPGSVPAGTPGTVPVIVQETAGTICSASPAGSQPSGSSFTLRALAAGTCTVTVVADMSTVLGASADNVVLSIPVAGGTSATPPPAGCDLVKNGKCYHRLVQDAQTFSKYVVPDVACTSECHYINAIQQIYLGYAYGIQPPVPAVDSAHELLFRIDSIAGVLYQCVPFSYLETSPVGPITGPSNGIGAPVGPPPGFGQPSIYLTINHVELGWSAMGYFIEPSTGWSSSTTLTNMYESVATRLIGEPLDFTYSSADASKMQQVLWYPDFPSCDAIHDPNSPGVQYGNSAANLVFEIYQAVLEGKP
jgi:prepilin-type N-terminal cleavage/methylation domain-containing protein